ncbi:MAG: hypothetical protein ABI551_21020 [Polyangiaceae bacterium]
MIYRKASRQPARMLLKIAAAAVGAGALVNVAACGGQVDGPGDTDTCSADHPCGSVPSTCTDDAGNAICGISGDPDAGGGLYSNDSGPSGIVDAGPPQPCVDDAGNPTCGISVNPDGGSGGLMTDAGEGDQ